MDRITSALQNHDISRLKAECKRIRCYIRTCFIDDSGNTIGYVFTVEGKGFDGTISVQCAIGTDGTIIKCAALNVSSETKTLGGKTANPEYADQYTGKSSTLDGVDAISGATITSTAYKGCVENAFAAYELVKEAE